MSRFSAWWFAPAPAERLAALRILLGGFALAYLATKLPELVAVARLPHADFMPTGIVRVLAVPLAPALAIGIAVVTCALLALVVVGFAHRIVAPIAALGLLWTLSYRSSWGQVFHTDNLIVLHVIVLACAPAADCWTIRRARRDRAPDHYGWPIKLLVALTAATYLVAGIAKLRIAGFGWIDGDQLRDQIAADNLRKALFGDRVGVFARSLLEHPIGLTIAAVLTLGLELTAPIVLFGGRIARIWAYTAWGFHVGVMLWMNIVFMYPLVGFAFLPMFPVERWLRRDLRRKGMPAPA